MTTNGVPLIGPEDLTEPEQEALTDWAITADSDHLRKLNELLGARMVTLESLFLDPKPLLGAIMAARSEFEEAIRLKMLLMHPQALETLGEVMAGNIPDKKAGPAFKAASDILNRGGIVPRVTRRETVNMDDTQGQRMAVPSFEEVIANSSPDDVHHVVDDWLAMMDHVRRVRTGEEVIIDGSPADIAKASDQETISDDDDIQGQEEEPGS